MRTLGLVLALVACGATSKSAKTAEGPYHGDVAVTFVNEASRKVCILSVHDPQATELVFHKLIDDFTNNQMDPGGRQEFHLRPGSYRLAAIACGEKTSRGSNVLSGELEITIDAPLSITIADSGAGPTTIAMADKSFFGASRGGVQPSPGPRPAGGPPPSGPTGSSQPQCKPLGADCMGDFECCGSNKCTNPTDSSGQPISGKLVCKHHN